MAKISESEKKRIIAQIKRRKLSPADLARRGLLNRTVAPPTIPFDDIRRMLEKAGLNINKLKEIGKREQREQERLRKEQTAAAKKALAAIKDPFRHGIEERIKALKLLSKFARPGQVDHVILDTPLLIWAIPDSMLEDSVIRPFKSIAKFAFTVVDPPTDPGQDFKASQNKASFYFLWVNNYGQEVMINAEASVIAKGFFFIRADLDPWNILTVLRGDVSSFVGLDIFELWNHPNTSPLPEEGQFVHFADILVDGGRLWGVPLGNDKASAVFFRTLNPIHNGFFVVPRNASVLFEVFVHCFTFLSTKDFFGDDPSIFAEVDFDVDDFVEVPFVHLEVIVPPIAT